MSRMSTHLETKLEIKSWDEKSYRELGDGQKFTRADVALSVSEEGIEAAAGSESLLYYRADGTSRFVSLMHVAGRLGERTGSFVLAGSGTYDGSQARVDYSVVDGSGTGDLSTLRGTGVSVSSHADYPFMPLTLDYEIG